MHIEEIIQRVKAEVGELHVIPPTNAFVDGNVRHEPTLAIKSRYHIQELLAVDDENLVTTAYRSLLGREPDPSAGNYHQKLVSRSLTPVEIVGRIRFSAEGRAHGVPVQGLVSRLVFCYLKKIPLLGYLLDLLVTFLRLPLLKRDIAALRSDIVFLRKDLLYKADRAELEHKADRAELEHKADRAELEHKADRAELEHKADRAELEPKADRAELEHKADRAELEHKADSRELLAYKEAVRYAEMYFHVVSQQLQELLDKLKKVPSARSAQEDTSVSESTSALAAGLYDKLYLDFESFYRGTQQEVSAALEAYAGLLASPGTSSIAPQKAIDLGSGRGEMVRFLSAQGYDTTGVDLNRVAIMSCQEEGLNAVHADVLNYLKGIEQGSVAVITSLHLVEHLEHGDLLLLLQRALQALAPGGMLLLETPNPRNLLVGAGDFYRDYTHVKPLFPDTLRFLLDHFGFINTAICFFEDADGHGRRLISSEQLRFDDLSDYLNISRDYAVVGYKRCE